MGALATLVALLAGALDAEVCTIQACTPRSPTSWTGSRHIRLPFQLTPCRRPPPWLRPPPRWTPPPWLIQPCLPPLCLLPPCQQQPCHQPLCQQQPCLQPS